MRGKRDNQLSVHLSEQIRQAIDESGLTRYEIARQSGVDESALSKFYRGERGLSPKLLDALGQCLGLMIIVKRKGD